MTRKDFEAIAKAIAFARRYRDPTLAFTYLENCLAETFRGCNPRFDTARFLAACNASPAAPHPEDQRSNTHASCPSE